MDKQLAELANKVTALSFRLSKTDEVMAKHDRQALEQQQVSINDIGKAFNTLKESIEDKKFPKGESEENVAKWIEEIDRHLAEADEVTGRLVQQIKQMNGREREDAAIHEHKRNLQFEKELLEQKAKFEEDCEEEMAANTEQNQPTSAAKLPKLPITKFNGRTEEWLPFWGKSKSEIDSRKLSSLAQFAYLKELSVRTDIDGLPFTEEGYAKAKDILEAEYGQSTEIVNAYVQGIMNLPVITGTNPKKIQDFYKQLRYNVQSLDTLGKLSDVKGNVRATLDKLKGIKADLVRGNEGW